MDRLTVDFGLEVWQLVQLCFFFAPIEAKHFLRQILYGGKCWSAIILPADHIGPIGLLDALV